MNTHKRLKQQYKETSRAMGVYRVFNQKDEISLVGVATDVQARLNRHHAELKFGGHRNCALQADWNRLGEGQFIFQIVELLAPLDKPNYDPSQDLEQLLEITLAQQEYSSSNLYNGMKLEMP